MCCCITFAQIRLLVILTYFIFLLLVPILLAHCMYLKSAIYISFLCMSISSLNSATPYPNYLKTSFLIGSFIGIFMKNRFRLKWISQRTRAPLLKNWSLFFPHFYSTPLIESRCFVLQLLLSCSLSFCSYYWTDHFLIAVIVDSLSLSLSIYLTHTHTQMLTLECYCNLHY